MKKTWLMTAAIMALSAGQVRAEEAAGDWGGLLAGQLHVIIHVKKAGDGSYSASLESPDQGTFVLPADTVTATPDHLAFAIAKISGSYDGTWDATKNAWVGTWTQGQAMPLVLSRLTADQAKAAPQRRPEEEAINAGPLPYTSSDVTFDNAAAKVTLAGTFSVPQGTGPFPAVVLISGSGPNTRDENVFNHKVFLVIADALNRAGITVLRYDKRGVGASTGDYKSATTADFTSDAEAAVAWLKTQKQVDPNHIGVAGHSEGGLIAPAVAVADPSVKFVVMMAGPGLRGDRILTMQQDLIARAMGATDAQIGPGAAINRKIYDAVLAANDIDDAKIRVKAALGEEVAAGRLPADKVQGAIDEVTAPWMFAFLRYDPVPTLRQVKVPVLAIDGSLDLQVPPKEDLAAIAAALAGNPDVTTTELPGLNHLMQTATTGAPSEYGAIEETVAPLALKTITDWVVAHSH